MLFRYNLLVAASFFPFSLLLCSALFAFLLFLFWCYKYRSRNNYSGNKNICAYCYTFLTFIIRNYFSPQPPSLFFPFCNLHLSHLRIYSVYFTREGGRLKVLINLALSQLSCSISLSFQFFNLSSLIIPISILYIIYIFVFSLPLPVSYSLLSLSPSFTSLTSRAFSLRFSGLRCAHTMIDLHPSYFRCFKIYPLSRLYVSCSLSLFYFCTRFAISFLFRFLRRSRVFLPLTFSVHPFLFAVSLFFHFFPVLRLRLSPRALIWPPGVQLLASFSLQFFRHRIFADGCDEERVLINLRGNTPFYFFAFFPRCDPFILIHRPVSRFTV